ncbi:integrin-linked protein kinase 1-like [Phragmites australis]|uniref:integrin-linked protein kinase 1-like n=1 Tax=Phragmites australis TaxID=29695 RepID=UPI002D798674|nr:integrin-linked protein kinase 1-like [Phragmites australis]
METKPVAPAAGPPTPRFRLGRQSSLAPDHVEGGGAGAAEGPAEAETNGVMRFQLMYLAHEGNAEGIRELLDGGADPNFRDSDGRTALHIAACEGHPDVVELLLQRGAEAAVEDQWGSTPLADAMHYQNHDVIKILEKHGSKLKIAPMHVNNGREVPEYEIDPNELDFTNSSNISKGTYRKATWRGIPVAVKKLDDDLIMDENKVQAFRDELDVLQLIRHPNVVQFLGAVTQSSPMMIVMEFLRKGDLRTHLNKKGALAPSYAVKFALDIARGMSYLHEHKPQAIIHRDLEPSNILRDDTGHLKVADFDLCKMLKWRRKVREEKAVTSPGNACRYVAPEVMRNEEYDTKVDVFSFALILQEMIEGCLPYHDKKNGEIEKAHISKERPPFRAPPKHYAHGLRELIEQCWSENPANRPDFRVIINRLSAIQNEIAQRNRWKVKPLKCFLSFEGMWKKDRNEGSTTRSSRSSRSNF